MFGRIVSIVLFWVLRACAIMLGWSWFIAPTFHGIPGFPASLALWQAMGLSLFVGLFLMHHSHADAEARTRKGDTLAWREDVVFGIGGYLFYFLLAIGLHSVS